MIDNATKTRLIANAAAKAAKIAAIINRYARFEGDPIFEATAEGNKVRWYHGGDISGDLGGGWGLILGIYGLRQIRCFAKEWVSAPICNHQGEETFLDLDHVMNLCRELVKEFRQKSCLIEPWDDEVICVSEVCGWGVRHEWFPDDEIQLFSYPVD